MRFYLTKIYRRLHRRLHVVHVRMYMYSTHCRAGILVCTYVKKTEVLVLSSLSLASSRSSSFCRSTFSSVTKVEGNHA